MPARTDGLLVHEVAPAGERRAAARFACDVPARCRLPADGHGSWPARVRDVSRHGVGLLAARRFEPGTLLAVELDPSADAAPRLLLARVVHAQSARGRNWLVGCRFLRPLADDEVAALEAHGPADE